VLVWVKPSFLSAHLDCACSAILASDSFPASAVCGMCGSGRATGSAASAADAFWDRAHKRAFAPPRIMLDTPPMTTTPSVFFLERLHLGQTRIIGGPASIFRACRDGPDDATFLSILDRGRNHREPPAVCKHRLLIRLMPFPCRCATQFLRGHCGFIARTAAERCAVPSGTREICGAARASRRLVHQWSSGQVLTSAMVRTFRQFWAVAAYMNFCPRHKHNFYEHDELGGFLDPVTQTGRITATLH